MLLRRKYDLKLWNCLFLEFSIFLESGRLWATEVKESKTMDKGELWYGK